MKIINISVIICAIALLSVSSCVKENPYIGNAIRFSAATEFQNGVETRTEYSNTEVTVSGNKFERINWISGDDINILYKHGNNSSSAIYNIARITNPSDNETDLQKKKKSTATVSLATGISGNTALEWADGTPVFYAVYPATVSSGTAPSVSSSGVVSNLSVPATQTVTWNSTQSKYLPDMRNAYMVSYASSAQISGDAVTLPFSPAVTALDFKLKLSENKASQAVKQVHLQSSTSALAGSYTVTISGFSNDAVTWSASSNSTAKGITVNFKNGNNSSYEPAMSFGSYLDFTIFVLPTSGVTNLSLLIKYHDDTVKTLSLSGLTLTPGRKYKITNDMVPNLDYDYYITPISDITLAAGHSGGSQAITIESYKQDKTNGNNKKPVPWKTQYWNGTTWVDFTTAGFNNFSFPTNISNNSVTGSGSIPNNGESRTVSLSGTASYTTHIYCPPALKANTFGDSSTPYDLSLNGGSTRNTANCYIVTGPGYYMFPCVYGNGIKGGSQNKSAFWPSGANDATNDAVSEIQGSSVTKLSQVNTTYNIDTNPDVYYMPRFMNVKASDITSEFIVSDLTYSGFSWIPVVVWQDVPPGQEIIPYDSNTDITNGDGSYIGKKTVSIGGTNRDFIWFYIDPDNIKPGNIVIAMRGSIQGKTDPEILWSWHIWIPETTPSTESNSSSITFLDRNLGEVVQQQVTEYAERSLKFRIIQTETGGTSEEFTVKQNADITSPSAFATRNTYYQWGRKDPMLNTNSNSYVSLNSNLTITRNNCFTSFQGFTFDENDIDRPRGIRAPYYLLNNSRSNSWLDGDVYPFLSYYYEQANAYELLREERGPFTESAALWLNTTHYTDGTQWHPIGPNQWYIATGKTLRTGPYTLTEVSVLTAKWNYPGTLSFSNNASCPSGWQANPWRCLPLSDFTQDTPGDNNSTWTFHDYSQYRGAFTQEQHDYINAVYNSHGETIPGSSFWKQNNTAQNIYRLYATADYYYGPYDQTEYTNMTTYCGFSSTDFDGPKSWIEEVWHTAAERQTSSIPYNLWNSYLYSEDTHCDDVYDNKFKTVYDPCPPGYTVPTKNELIVTGYPARGSHPGTSQNGYWTDHACSMKATSNNGYDRMQLSNFYDYQNAFWKTSGSNAAKTTRSTAASIRPMQDPKNSGAASVPTRANVQSNSIESLSFGSDL